KLACCCLYVSQMGGLSSFSSGSLLQSNSSSSSRRCGIREGRGGVVGVNGATLARGTSSGSTEDGWTTYDILNRVVLPATAAAKRATPHVVPSFAPHVVTLHMGYMCTCAPYRFHIL
ncbi:hypothetical protein VaNZ11_001304, partial [Volvox africanus]